MIKSAPFSFLVFLVIGCTSGYLASSWYYSKQISDQSGQVIHYRMSLGIEPKSKGALVELNNAELALKAQNIVVNLRELVSDLDAKSSAIKKQVDDKKLDKQKAFAQETAAAQEVSNLLDQNLASDALNVEGELRKRLDPEAISHIVRVPAFIAGDSRVTMMALMRGSPSNAFLIKGLADEIEQMAKLLPADSAKP